MEIVRDNTSNNQELLANFFLIGGGVLFAVFPKLALEWWIFLFFLFGHVVYAFRSKRISDRNMFMLNVGLACLDIYAMIIRM